MKVLKALNNSLLLVENEDGQEMVVLGKGIGFQRKPGQDVPVDLIEKTFILKDETTTRQYVRLIEETPDQYVELTNQIIAYAEAHVSGTLSDEVYIRLVDHIAYALTRYEQNITLQNRLLWEVRKFYPKEFAAGQWAVRYLNEQLHIALPEEEAGNIAFHFVSAQTGAQEMETAMLSLKMQKDILNLIQYQFHFILDQESLDFSRFLTHIQFFIQRLLEDKMLDNDDLFLFSQVAHQYPPALTCAKSIGTYVQKTLNKTITREELLYLAIHILRIVPKEK